MSSDILDQLDDLDDDLFDEGDEAGDELDAIAQDLESSAMSEARARELTEAIRAAATATYILLAEAHAKQAHKAMGYDTWADYVQNEFDMSAQRSYQLLDLSRVVDSIEAVVPEGTKVKLTEAQARDIKRELPRVTEQIREAVEDLDADASADEVDRIVNEVREQKKADDDANEARAKEAAQAQQDGYQAGLEAAGDSLLEDAGYGTDGSETVEVADASDSGISPEDSMNVYNFFNVLAGVSTLPEPDEFLRVIPKNRAEEVNNQLLETVAWLNRFQTLWELENEE